MQMYGKIEGFPLNCALFGLVSYNDPCFWSRKNPVPHHWCQCWPRMVFLPWQVVPRPRSLEILGHGFSGKNLADWLARAQKKTWWKKELQECNSSCSTIILCIYECQSDVW